MLDATFARRARFFILAVVVLAAIVGMGDAAPAPSAVCAGRVGAVQLLAEISNTRDSNVDCLGLRIDGNTFSALHIESHRASTSDVRIQEFPISQIASKRGAVLDGAEGHDAVIVHGSVSLADGRASLVTSYLYNGLTGEYRSCPILIDRVANAVPSWRLVNRFHETVSRIVVRTHIVPVLGTIGIASLDGICTPVA